MQPGDRGVHGADDRLGRARPVHQIDGGSAVGGRDGCYLVGRRAAALPGAEYGFCPLRDFVDADVADHDQVGVGGAVVPVELAHDVVPGQRRYGLFSAR